MNWTSNPPQNIASLLRDAIMWTGFGSRMATGRYGARRVVAPSTLATGEVATAPARVGLGHSSSLALKNTPGVNMPVLTGINALTAVIVYNKEMPSLYSNWVWGAATEARFTGGRDNGWFVTFDVGFGGDGSFHASIRNAADVAVTAAYRAVPYTVGTAPPGMLMVALRWMTGEVPMIRVLDRYGRIWAGGAIGSTTLAGPIRFGTTPWMLAGGTNPDNTWGSQFPVPFNGAWARPLSDGTLSTLAREIGRAISTPTMPRTTAPFRTLRPTIDLANSGWSAS